MDLYPFVLNPSEDNRQNNMTHLFITVVQFNVAILGHKRFVFRQTSLAIFETIHFDGVKLILHALIYFIQLSLNF